MNNLGWISLDRKIIDNWVWKDKPFSTGQAWVDMLLRANHKENQIMFEGKVITVQRGSFVTSILKLSDAYGWDRRKFTKFFDALESQKMVTTNRTTHGTTVTIVNYDVYQIQEQPNEQPNEQPAHNHGTQTIMITMIIMKTIVLQYLKILFVRQKSNES